MMNQRSRLIAKEIEQKDPEIIIICGSRNPTYSSDTFIFILIKSRDKYLEFIGEGSYIGYNGKIEVLLSEWILEKIRTSDSDYILEKIEDRYIMTYEECLEDFRNGEYASPKEFCDECPGEIEVIMGSDSKSKAFL